MNNDPRPRPIALLFFARLSEQLGVRQERLELPGDITTAQQLRQYLSERGGNWQALASDNVRMAVNQEVGGGNTPVEPGDEIAFFPPVTGG